MTASASRRAGKYEGRWIVGDEIWTCRIDRTSTRIGRYRVHRLRDGRKRPDTTVMSSRYLARKLHWATRIGAGEPR